MKVLHISTHRTGGAALAAFRLHRSLIDKGIDSRMLTLDEDCDDNNVVCYKPAFGLQKSKIFKSTLYRLGIGIGRYWRMHDKARKGHECQYTYPVSLYRVERHPLVKWTDVIHLHFCDDFINYPTFFKKVKKPIVWTLHDIGIGYGGFHYKNDYDALLPYYKELETTFLKIKSDSISKAQNLSIVSLSQEMYDFTKKIDYLRDKPNHIVFNSVDSTKFLMLDKKQCRSELGLPQDKKILLFVSEYVEVQSKGLSLLKEAIRSMHQENILLCIVGNHSADLPSKDIVATRYLGKITDLVLLSKLYSAADFLVVPSSQEVCCQTPMEAMSCGTPVVVFPSGAMKDYVRQEQGVVCKDCSLESLKGGLAKALAKEYNRAELRKYAIDNFSPTRIAEEYIMVYKNALANRV